MALGEWLKKHNIPAMYGIDTRALTKRVRSKGAILGKLIPEGADDVPFGDPNQENLVAMVSRKTVKVTIRRVGLSQGVVSRYA